MKKERFNKYIQLKKQISYNYKGYPIENIVAIDIAIWLFAGMKFTIKSSLSFLIKQALPYFVRALKLDELKINEPSKTLFSMGLFNRDDYYEVWDGVKQRVNNKISFDFAQQEPKFKFSLKKIILAFSIIRKTTGIELIAKIWLAARITHYLHVIDEIEKIKPVAGKYCAFAATHDLETLLTYYFKKQKTVTYSLQHGIDYLHRERVELSAMLYENFISDYRMCWGKFTKDEFVEYGIDPDSLIVAGYARKVFRPKLPKKLNKQDCIVFLASSPYRDANLKLLKILQKLEGINISLKPHPRIGDIDYSKIADENKWKLIGKEKTITELFTSNEYGWAISVNSSAYYEAYMYNIPCLRFNDGSFSDLVDVKEDRFSNFQELKAQLNSIPFEDTDKIEEYFRDVNKNLDYAIGINTDEYHLLECQSKVASA